MQAVTVEKYRGSEYKVIFKGRVKAKHMNEERANKFAKTLDPNYKKPRKKGIKKPSKTAVKLAKKPVRQSRLSGKKIQIDDEKNRRLGFESVKMGIMDSHILITFLLDYNTNNHKFIE